MTIQKQEDIKMENKNIETVEAGQNTPEDKATSIQNRVDETLVELSHESLFPYVLVASDKDGIILYEYVGMTICDIVDKLLEDDKLYPFNIDWEDLEQTVNTQNRFAYFASNF